MTEITRRIEKELGVPNLARLLGEGLDPSDLQSLLVEVYRQVVKRRTPAGLLSYYRSNRLTKVADQDPARLLEWDRIAFSNLPEGFRAIELSPVSPLGSVSLLAPISQDWVLTSIRNVEVSADPTNILALESAVRRQECSRNAGTRKASVKLAASQRVVRSQRYDSPYARAHFRLFSLCTAGRDTGGLRFEVGAVYQHAQFYLNCLRIFLGSKVPLHLTVFDLRREGLSRTERISAVKRLQQKFRNVKVDVFKRPEEGRNYYKELRFHISGFNNQGREIELADGGDTDWTQKLLGSAKERLIISGIGTERVCGNFEPLSVKE